VVVSNSFFIGDSLVNGGGKDAWLVGRLKGNGPLGVTGGGDNGEVALANGSSVVRLDTIVGMGGKDTADNWLPPIGRLIEGRDGGGKVLRVEGVFRSNGLVIPPSDVVAPSVSLVL
jgi:hypothetical protein